MKHTLRISMLALAAALGLATHMAYGAPPTENKDGVLVDAKGMTLYTFDNDKANSGKSACTGPCTGNWPPLQAEKDDKPMGPYSIITREDGMSQWTFQGKPLYRYKGDSKPGDMGGDNVRGIWHPAKK